MDVDDENDVVWRMLRDAFGETDGPMDTASSSSSTTDTRHSLKRRKDEIRTLKNEIETLERQRDELSRLERPTPSRAASVNEVWRDLATRQARKRRQAEQLNSRLRTSLETQSKIQKELVRLVQRATTPEDQTWLVRSVYGGVPRCFQSKSEESELLCRLERLYEQRDDALGAERYPPSRPAFCDALVIKQLPQRVIVDVQMAWVVPYPVRLVEDALWHLIQRKTAWQEGRGYQNQIVTEDLVLLSFASSDPRLAGEYSGKLATKRFYVGPESLFVTSMKAAPQGDALKMPGGLVVLQEAWTQVRALDDAASTQPLVQIQSRRCTYVYGDPKYPQEIVMAIARSLRSELKRDHVWQRETLEEILLSR